MKMQGEQNATVYSSTILSHKFHFVLLLDVVVVLFQFPPKSPFARPPPQREACPDTQVGLSKAHLASPECFLQSAQSV